MRHGTTPALLGLTVAACLVMTTPAAAGGDETTPAAAGGDEWTIPDNWLGYRVAPLLLLSRADVRADLKLTDGQSQAARQLIADLRKKASTLPKEDTPEIVARRRAIDQEQQEWLTSQLSPDQQARLSQIDLQWEGSAALVTRKELARSIGLSKEQTASLKAAVSRCDQKRHEPKADWRAAERTLAEEALSLLKEDQRRHWLALLGTHVEFRMAEAATKPAARK